MNKSIFKHIRLGLVVLVGANLLGLAAYCNPSKAAGNVDKLASGNQALAFELYSRLVKDSPKSNLAFSPHSIAEVLTLATGGARGDTAMELTKALQLSLPVDQAATLLGAVDRQLAGGTRPQPNRLGLHVESGAKGVTIEDIVKESPAERAGLKKGQVILAVDGKNVRSVAEYHAALAERPGPAFVLEVAFGKNSSVPYRLTAASSPDNGFRYSTANALWGRKDLAFNPAFLDIAKTLGAAVEDLDFKAPEAARDLINQWVSRKTESRISELLPSGSVKPDGALILTNAVFFQGLWEKSFSTAATKPGPFRGLDGNLMVPMMQQTGRFRLYSTSTHKILEMPFHGTSIVMDLILPDKGITLADFEKNEFKPANWSKWLSELRRERMIQVKLPRFNVSSQHDLRDALGSLGVRLAFERKADFNGIADTRDLMFGLVTHQASIRMQEDGLVAAAATAATLVAKSFDIEEAKFIADRPFLMVIRDRDTGVILFMGRVVEPEKAR